MYFVFIYDKTGLVFNEEGLRHLVAVAGASQVVYGSDMPFAWPDTIDLIADPAHIDDSLAFEHGQLNIELIPHRSSPGEYEDDFHRPLTIVGNLWYIT